jgi:hypothetical protein
MEKIKHWCQQYLDSPGAEEHSGLGKVIWIQGWWWEKKTT